MSRWLVVGGGVSGCAGAAWLAAHGHAVTLVERGATLGRVANAFAWNGFHLDYGCHLFGNDADASSDLLLSLLGGEVVEVNPATACIWNGRRSEGFEIPDLTLRPEAETTAVLAEILAAAARTDTATPGSLADLLTRRYGPTAAALLAEPTLKAFRSDPAALSPAAFATTPFRRLRVVADEVALLLKQLPALDDRLAASTAGDPLRFHRARVARPFRAFYPARHGMRGFAEAAEAHLRGRGVDLRMECQLAELELSERDPVAILSDGEEAAFDRILWASGLDALEPHLLGTTEIGSHVHGVPMVLFYFAIAKEDEGPFSYVQNFDGGDLAYRLSLPGRYGRENCPPGLSYACCEVPTDRDAAVWNDPEAHVDVAFEELLRAGVVRGAAREHVVRKVPVSYRVPRVGFEAACEPLRKQLERDGRIVHPDPGCFTTAQNVQSVVAGLEAAP